MNLSDWSLSDLVSHAAVVMQMIECKVHQSDEQEKKPYHSVGSLGALMMSTKIHVTDASAEHMYNESTIPKVPSESYRLGDEAFFLMSGLYTPKHKATMSSDKVELLENCIISVVVADIALDHLILTVPALAINLKVKLTQCYKCLRNKLRASNKQVLSVEMVEVMRNATDPATLAIYWVIMDLFTESKMFFDSPPVVSPTVKREEGGGCEYMNEASGGERDWNGLPLTVDEKMEHGAADSHNYLDLTAAGGSRATPRGLYRDSSALTYDHLSTTTMNTAAGTTIATTTSATSATDSHCGEDLALLEEIEAFTFEEVLQMQLSSTSNNTPFNSTDTCSADGQEEHSGLLRQDSSGGMTYEFTQNKRKLGD